MNDCFAKLASALVPLLVSAAHAGAPGPSVPERVTPVEGVAVPTSFEPWTMKGATPQELQAEQISSGPCGRLACTDWIIDPTFSFEPAGPECAVTTIHVKVTVTYRLPIWEPAKPLPPAARTWWQGALPKILAHEGGHRDLAVATANRLHETLSALPPGPTCAELVARARSEAVRLIEDGERRQREYDTHTEHTMHRTIRW